MLTLAVLDAGESGGYYLKSVPDGPADYYLDSPAGGYWLGQGSTRLGLDGTVSDEAFRRVLAGADPTTGEMLVSGKAADPGRTPGYDLLFSPPKSVTLLAVFAERDVAEQVRQAHRQAVADTMTFIETEVAAARRGDGGTRQLPAELVAAGFEHHTSRAVDPQLHTHVVVANVGFASDGRWSAVHGQRLYGWAKTGGFVYQAALRVELTERLGVAWGPIHNGSAEIQGFTGAQLEAFSTRRAEIKAELARVGQTSARAAQLAAYATRDPKVDLPAAALQQRWWARAAEVGITAELVASIPGRHLDRPSPEPTELTDDLLGATGLTHHSSVFDRRHALQAVAAGHPDGVAVADTVRLADRVLADRQSVPLPEPTRLGDRRYSTVEMLATEELLLGRARARRRAGVAVADPDALSAALARRPTLADEQRAMVAALTTSGAGVQAVVGVAGAGKTFALDAARDAWETSGITVIGAALAARAAAELQAGSGIPSTTLDRLLIDAERPGPGGGLPYNGAVVIDEAGMVGSRKLGRLLAVAERSRTAVILVGDPRQLPEIEAGGSFTAITKAVPTVELHTNRRQVHEWERTALAELRSGDVAKAVTLYRDRERIHVYPDAESCRDGLVDDWWAARQAGSQADMYALRRADVEDLNRRARVRVAQAGLLSAETVTAGERRYAVGDEVLALRNDRRLQVVNGTRATVTAVDPAARTITIQTGDNSVVVPPGYLDAGHLSHGYAITINKSEGGTTGRSFSLGSDTLYREAGYVTLSRARERSDIYLVAPVRRGRDHRDLDPINRLAGDLARSHAQQLATPQVGEKEQASLADLEDERDRLRQQIGVPPVRPVGDPRVPLDRATSAREAAQERLDQVGHLPRRQRAAFRATAEQALGDACAREMRAVEAFHVAEGDRVIWEHWLAENSHPLARYRQLGVEIDRRRQALEAVALADSAGYHLDLLGPPPLTGSDRERWAESAATVDSYRDRWHVTGPQPLGPIPEKPEQAEQARQRAAVERSVDQTRRAIELDHQIDHGMEI